MARSAFQMKAARRTLFNAFNAIPLAENTRLFGPDSTNESDLCTPVNLNNEIYDTELKEEGYFEVNVLVKWAHLCYLLIHGSLTAH